MVSLLQIDIVFLIGSSEHGNATRSHSLNIPPLILHGWSPWHHFSSWYPVQLEVSICVNFISAGFSNVGGVTCDPSNIATTQFGLGGTSCIYAQVI